MEIMKSKIVGKPVFTITGSESLSLSEVKQHLYIESGNTDFDTLLTTLITEVRDYIEQVTGLSLVEKTITIIIDYECGFGIPYGPVTTFTSASCKSGINTYDAVTNNEDYEVEAGRFISYAGSNRFKLIYDAGYTSSTIPEGLKLAFKNEVARRFDNRGDGQIPVSNDLLDSFKDLEWTI
jgi:hypothetical protein